MQNQKSKTWVNDKMNASLNSEILINRILKIKKKRFLEKMGLLKISFLLWCRKWNFSFSSLVTRKAYPVSQKAYPVSRKAYPVFRKDFPVSRKAYPVSQKVYPVPEKSTQVAFSGNQPVSLSFTFANKDNSYDLSFFPFFKNNNENGMESNHEYVFFEARIIFNISCIHNI